MALAVFVHRTRKAVQTTDDQLLGSLGRFTSLMRCQ